MNQITPVSDKRVIASYNYGPLTNRVSLSSTCTEVFTPYAYNYDGTSFLSVNWYMGHPGYPRGGVIDPNCYPSMTKPDEWEHPDRWHNWYYHSPGVCPQSWTIAKTWEKDFQGLALGPDTSAALCCPSGWVGHTYYFDCRTTLSSGTIYKGYGIGTNQGLGPVAPLTFSFNEYVTGQGIPIWWQQSDFPTSSTTGLTSMIGSSGPPNPTVSPPPIDTSRSNARSSGPPIPTVSPPSIDTSRSGISTGVKIAIGVGIPFAVLFVVAIGSVIFIRRRRQKAESGGPGPEDIQDVPEWVGRLGGKPQRPSDPPELVKKGQN